MANAANLVGDYMRNLESFRVGTVTGIRPQEGALIEIGGGYVHRALDHPIFQYLEQNSNDFVLFGRSSIEGTVAGLENSLTIGLNAGLGRMVNRRFVNIGGRAGQQTYGSVDDATTLDAYAQNSLTVLPGLQLIAGLSLGYAMRDSDDDFLSNGDQSGSGTWSWTNPRLGLLWQATPDAQVFANLAWATEPPTFTDLIPQVPQGGFQNLEAQRSTTIEVGTRGATPAFSWEVALYRSWIRDEIQLFTFGNGMDFAVNADRTIHQGIEAGAAWTFLRDSFAAGDNWTLTQAYTFSDFYFDGDPRLWRQSASGRAPAPVPRGAALPAFFGRLDRTQCRMGAPGLLRRQCKHAEDRRLLPGRHPRRLGVLQRHVRLRRSAQSGRHEIHRLRLGNPTRNAAIPALRTRHRTRCLCRAAISLLRTDTDAQDASRPGHRGGPARHASRRPCHHRPGAGHAACLCPRGAACAPWLRYCGNHAAYGAPAGWRNGSTPPCRSPAGL
jgi:hypothetical protein